jgi:predicted HNH restriction endonuclease
MPMIFELDMDFEREKERRDKRADEIAEKCRERRRTSNSSRARTSFKKRTAARTGPVCEVCQWDARKLGWGDYVALAVLHAHHIVPVACGGQDTDSNFVLLCPNCHALAHHYGGIIWHKDTHKRGWNGPITREEFFIAAKDPDVVLPRFQRGA